MRMNHILKYPVDKNNDDCISFNVLNYNELITNTENNRFIFFDFFKIMSLFRICQLISWPGM